MKTTQPSRRQFLRVAAAAAASALGLLVGSRPARALAVPDPAWEHPRPRPGIDASKVLTAEQLRDTPDVIPIYDGIREIPHIADGIRCHCGCANLPGYRSLLTCYEEGEMAKHCHVCQGQGRLTVRRHAEGQTLDQIRRAIDARYSTIGPPGARTVR